MPFGLVFTDDPIIIEFLSISIIVFIDSAIYLPVVSVTVYFASYSRNIMAFILFFIFLFRYSLFYLTTFSLAQITGTIIQIGIFIAFFVILYKNRNEIKQYLTHTIGLLFLLVLIITMYLLVNLYQRFQGFDSGLYSLNDPVIIILSYGVVMMLNLIGIIIFLYLEQGIYRKQKD